MNRREVIKLLTGTGAATVALAATGVRNATAQENTSGTKTNVQSSGNVDGLVQRDNLQFWLETSLQRVYPTSTPGEASTAHGKPLLLKSGRNYRLSFQVCVRNTSTSSAQLECSVKGFEGIHTTVRRVGNVPMHGLDTYTPMDELDGKGKIPGLCPDPLFPEQSAHIGPLGTAVFWVSLLVPESVKPGKVTGSANVKLINRFGYMSFDNPEQFTQSLPVEVEVADVVVNRRKDFPATLWLSADSIWEYYKIPPFSDRFWVLAQAFIKNLVEHGIDCIYTPIFNIRAANENLIRPAQLLRVKRTGEDQYEFDFQDVRRWISLAKKHGANYVEFSHFFSPAPSSAAFPQRIHERDAEKIGDVLWPDDTPATSPTYRKFLEQFIPQFKAVLEEENMLEKSFFHLADEPDGETQIGNYRQARALLAELAPWMKVMDAMSDPHFATERLSDMPIPSIVTAHKFVEANCPAWVYYCCGPRDCYIQRLLDTPLYKIRMSGMLFYKLKAHGFLHWGYNYWFKFCTNQIDDPFADASNRAWPGMPYGDTFAVYPGADGPVDSIRWEVFAESLQDYALLQTLDIARDDELLKDLKDYNVFPKSAAWVDSAMDKLLGTAEK